MTNNSHRITHLLATLACAVALVLPACGGESKKVETKVTKTTKPETKTAPKPVEAKPVEAKPDTPETPPAPDPHAEKVQLAAMVAKEIAADPEHADDVLAKHNLDRAKLDALMFEIAADPALTEAYMAARRTT